ncbi:MAG TPA: penicillin acylase family protein [Desulfotignum sp.]|nr:penicillin acylase family protein [Desulfotignum sp.]
MKRWIYSVIAIVLVLGIGAGIFLNHLKTAALPVIDGNLPVDGLTAPVTVYRDAHGVPSITAENEGDLYRAVGYVMAQDRLWQMDLLRRVTLGRLSEIFGDSLVEVDMLMRALKISSKSRAILGNCRDQSLLTALDAFCAGVNAYIADAGSRLPPEFRILGYTPEPWEPLHSVNLIGYMAWDLTNPYGIEPLFHKIRHQVGDALYQELLPDLPMMKTPVHLPGYDMVSSGWDAGLQQSAKILENLGVTVFHGSNNWAAGPHRTQTGKPLFANDMHLGLNAPGLWYPMLHHAEGRVHVTGVVLPGQPFVIAGHNAHIAWGMTNVVVDDMDFFLEKTDDAHPGQYQYQGEWIDFETRQETIHIKDGEPVIRDLQFTRHGPVISRFKGLGSEVVSMKWIGSAMSNELGAVYQLNRAENWDDFRRAVKGFVAVSQNIAYADVQGNVGLQTCAGIPLRKKGSGMDIYPGWTDEYEWVGTVPFEALPYTFNPADGVVSSANNKTVDVDYPHHISHWFALHYRIDRIREMLAAKKSLSLEDFMAMQTDHQSRLAADLLPGLLSCLTPRSAELTGLEQAALGILSSWDGEMRKDAPAPAIFDKVYVTCARNLLADEMGTDLVDEFLSGSYPVRHAMHNIWPKPDSAWADNIQTPDVKESFSDIVCQSFGQAVAELAEKLGGDPGKWQWGSIHTLTLSHPLGSVDILDILFDLNRGPFPAPGSFHTVSPYAYKVNAPFDVKHGASQRHIYDLSDWDNSRVIIPTGSSGIPASPFYCSQAKMYMNGQFRQDLFTLERISAAAVHTLVLQPAGG